MSKKVVFRKRSSISRRKIKVAFLALSTYLVSIRFAMTVSSWASFGEVMMALALEPRELWRCFLSCVNPSSAVTVPVISLTGIVLYKIQPCWLSSRLAGQLRFQGGRNF